jgi:hypothetical protein
MPTARSSIDTPLAIEVQLRQEKASALRRTGEKLEKMNAELTLLGGELGALSGPAREKRVARYQELRAQAEYERWCLIVQREAMGLFDHSEVDLLYPIPPRVK